MKTTQDDPQSTDEPDPPAVWPGDSDDAEAEAARPAAEDDPYQTIEEPGYGHGV